VAEGLLVSYKVLCSLELWLSTSTYISLYFEVFSNVSRHLQQYTYGMLLFEAVTPLEKFVSANITAFTMDVI
jgi:hypothetical protein